MVRWILKNLRMVSNFRVLRALKSRTKYKVNFLEILTKKQKSNLHYSRSNTSSTYNNISLEIALLIKFYREVNCIFFYILFLFQEGVLTISAPLPKSLTNIDRERPVPIKFNQTQGIQNLSIYYLETALLSGLQGQGNDRYPNTQTN